MNNESPYNTENEGLCSRCDRQEAMKNIIFYCLVAEMHVHMRITTLQILRLLLSYKP